MSNKLADSFKRLEQVSNDTKIVTEKLRKSVEVITEKITDMINDNIDQNNLIQFKLITGKLFLINQKLYFDYDQNLSLDTSSNYDLYPSEGLIKKTVALEFAKAINNENLIEKITEFLNIEKNKIERELKILISNKPDLV